MLQFKKVLTKNAPILTLQFSAVLQVYHNVITTQNVLYISVESIPSPRPQPSAATNRLSVTLYSFLSTTSSYKWTHTVCCVSSFFHSA